MPAIRSLAGAIAAMELGVPPLLSKNLYVIDFMGYGTFCRRGFSREALAMP
jgi:hypothetical protein